MVYAALALGVLAAAFFMYVRVKKGGVSGVITKTIASIFFILTAVFALIQVAEKNEYGICSAEQMTYGILIVAGLVFGMLGDIALDLKYAYKQDNDVWTYSGMVAFALGHVCYLAAIYGYTKVAEESAWWCVVPLAVGALFGLIAVSLEKPMKLKYGKFKVISGVYGGILAAMVFSCASVMINRIRNDGADFVMWIVMTVGGVMFILSDLVLSGMYFDVDQKKNTPANVIINHTTYYIAQFCIAFAITLMK